jgi:hypothetical protein
MSILFKFVGSSFLLTFGIILLVCGSMMLYSYRRISLLEQSVIEHGKILQSFILNYNIQMQSINSLISKNKFENEETKQIKKINLGDKIYVSEDEYSENEYIVNNVKNTNSFVSKANVDDKEDDDDDDDDEANDDDDDDDEDDDNDDDDEDEDEDDDEDDEDEDDEDEDDEDEDDEDEDNTEPQKIVVSLEPDEQPVKIVNVNVNIESTNLDIEEINDLATDEIASIEEEPIGDIDINADPVIVHKILDEIVNNVDSEITVEESKSKDVYRNMNTNQLKQLVITKGLSTNPSKLKKNELIQLLENVDL